MAKDGFFFLVVLFLSMLLVRLLFQPAHSAVQVSANAGWAQQIQYYACPDHERSRPGEARTEPNAAQNTQPAAKHQKKHPSTTSMQEGTQREKTERERKEKEKNSKYYECIILPTACNDDDVLACACACAFVLRVSYTQFSSSMRIRWQ